MTWWGIKEKSRVWLWKSLKVIEIEKKERKKKRKKETKTERNKEINKERILNKKQGDIGYENNYNSV